MYRVVIMGNFEVQIVEGYLLVIVIGRFNHFGALGLWSRTANLRLIRSVLFRRWTLRHYLSYDLIWWEFGEIRVCFRTLVNCRVYGFQVLEVEIPYGHVHVHILLFINHLQPNFPGWIVSHVGRFRRRDSFKPQFNRPDKFDSSSAAEHIIKVANIKCCYC